jgi:hypothetical protein
MGASALANLLLDDWETPAKIRFVSLLYAAGGALAFPVGLFLARLVSLGRHWQVALAAAFVCLLATTIGLTGGLFALQYRSYYAQWHEPALTIAWSIQFVHTVATAFYQFIVLGIRLISPRFHRARSRQHLVCAAAALSILSASVRTRANALASQD